MKLKYPKIVRPIDLGEYAPEWGGQKVFVWVNPPADNLARMGDLFQAMLDRVRLPAAIEELEQADKPDKDMLKEYRERLDEVQAEKYANASDDFLAIMSNLLSQGDKETHVTLDEIKEIEKQTRETDPAFWLWLQNKVVDTITDHRRGQKKA